MFRSRTSSRNEAFFPSLSHLLHFRGASFCDVDHIESCLSKTPQARRITALAPNPPYIVHGWRRYPKYAWMACFFGYPKTGFHFAAINKSFSNQSLMLITRISSS